MTLDQFRHVADRALDPFVSASRRLGLTPDSVSVIAFLLAAGCFAVVNDRVPDAALRETLHTLIQRREEDVAQRLKAERHEDRSTLSDFVSKSPAIQAFMTTARRVVQSDSSLLILGETGGPGSAAGPRIERGPRESESFWSL